MMVNPKPWGLFLSAVCRMAPCSWDGSLVKLRNPLPGSSAGGTIVEQGEEQEVMNRVMEKISEMT